MKTKIYEKNNCSFYIRKESGNLHTKDKRTNEHEPVQYAAYYNEQEPLDLKSYMNITGKNLEGTVIDLVQAGIVLIGNRFEICFFDQEAVDLFIETIGAKEKIFQ